MVKSIIQSEEDFDAKNHPVLNYYGIFILQCSEPLSWGVEHVKQTVLIGMS